ncbi:MAG: hypothetical protein HEQ16_13530 [Bosea sp.]|nr:hypothetical protein [Bosea sp. (in: a-proteobacteria)]
MPAPLQRKGAGRIDDKRIGQAAALKLIAQVRGEACEMHTELPVELVIRRSCARPA